jgi:hypothetical protein
VRGLVGPFDEAALCYRWAHPDPRVDRLHEQVLGVVKGAAGQERRKVFAEVWGLAQDALRAAGRGQGERPPPIRAARRAPVPYISEPWYC